MKALHGSGGSTKGIGIYGAWKTIIQKKKYKPDLISGISISALMAVPVALGKWNELDSLFFNFDLDTFFNVKPINNKGKLTFRGILRFILGKSFGEQNNLVDILMDIVPEHDFEYFKICDDVPIVIVMAVDVFTGKRIFVNLKDVTYDQFLDYTLASASIPLYVPHVSVGEMDLYDGGMRNHIISHWCMRNFPIKESISVYSRPKEHETNKINKCKLSNIELLTRVQEILSIEISKSDEFEENTISKELNIKNHQIFLPKTLNSLYDVDRGRLNLLYLRGVNEALKLNI